MKSARHRSAGILPAVWRAASPALLRARPLATAVETAALPAGLLVVSDQPRWQILLTLGNLSVTLVERNTLPEVAITVMV